MEMKNRKIYEVGVLCDFFLVFHATLYRLNALDGKKTPPYSLKFEGSMEL